MGDTASTKYSLYKKSRYEKSHRLNESVHQNHKPDTRQRLISYV